MPVEVSNTEMSYYEAVELLKRHPHHQSAMPPFLWNQLGLGLGGFGYING